MPELLGITDRILVMSNGLVAGIVDTKTTTQNEILRLASLHLLRSGLLMSALNKKSFLTYLKEGGIYVALLVLLAIIIFQDPTFLSLLNLSNILTQSSVRIIIALALPD